MLLAYAISLLLIGLGAGFEHGVTQGLIVGALAALATGLSASALLHIAVVVGDREIRTKLWTKAGPFTRAMRAFFLVARAAAAIVMWAIAFEIAHR
jgi:thiamine transporter ThiT